MSLAACFGVLTLFYLLDLYATGFDGGNVFSAVVWALLCVRQLRTWLRLRAAAPAGATSMERL